MQRDKYPNEAHHPSQVSCNHASTHVFFTHLRARPFLTLWFGGLWNNPAAN